MLNAHDALYLTANDEIQALLEIARALKIEPKELKAVNPFTQKGPRAEALQLEADQSKPVMAAKWRADAGLTMNLETVAAEAGLIEHTVASKADLAAHSPVAAQQQADL